VTGTVSVAIPTHDAGSRFEEVLSSIRRQDVDVELIVLDSGSTDGTPELAERHGARVETIANEAFTHGGARNRLMAMSRGEHVAFLTQDAVPAGPDWLRRLLDGFALGTDVALVTGPYEPRPGASVMVRRELHEYWATMSPDGRPRRYVEADVVRTAHGLPNPCPATFATSANACLRRDAWVEVPFRDIAYAEDQQLALDLLTAGYAKVFQPAAPVIHSHEYRPVAKFRRTFDEFRALHEVYGHVEGFGLRVTLGRARVEARRDRAWLQREGAPRGRLAAATLSSFTSHLARGVGAGLGTRADALPPIVRRYCSLEGRP
jgi:glycosyltransferase involved in cell wall biosynthesis